jgi:hypothetical protein
MSRVAIYFGSSGTDDVTCFNCMFVRASCLDALTVVHLSCALAADTAEPQMPVTPRPGMQAPFKFNGPINVIVTQSDRALISSRARVGGVGP